MALAEWSATLGADLTPAQFEPFLHMSPEQLRTELMRLDFDVPLYLDPGSQLFLEQILQQYRYKRARMEQGRRGPGIDGISPDGLADIVRVRSELGFPVDPTTLRTLADQPEALLVLADWGTLLSRPELTEMRARRAAVDLRADLLATARKLDTFGGSYVDPHTGVLHVQLTDVNTMVEDSLLSLTKLPRWRVTFERVTYPEAALDSALDMLSGQMEKWGIVGIDRDTKSNSLEVLVAPDREGSPGGVDLRGLSETLSNVAGVPVRVKVGAVESTACSSRTNCGSPTRAGLYVTAPGSGTCTTGFLSTSGSNNYVLTAEHCFPSGAQATIGGQVSGTITVGGGQGNFANADVEAISIPASQTSNYVYATEVDRSHQITSRLGYNADNVGDFVCWAGQATNGVGCGTVTSTNYSTVYPDGQILLKQRKMSFAVKHGDSGGPVYSGNMAVGGISGITGSSPHETIYSHLYWMEYYTNSTVRTSTK